VASVASPFRDEARKWRTREWQTHGDPLRLSSRWTEVAYWFVVAAVAAGMLFLIVGESREYARGLAVIREEDTTTVTSLTGGSIAAVFVRAGQRVDLHEPLLRFDDALERSDRDRLARELEVQQINWLTNPEDSVARQHVAALRGRLDGLHQQLADKTVTAPRAGTVGDVRIRRSQLVGPGESLMTIRGDERRLSVIAVLPGHNSALLDAGDRLRIELNGFPYAFQALSITAVGAQVVGPAEIRRYLGPEIADSVTIHGASTIVKARVPSNVFKAQGRWHRYHDGMLATAEARVRLEPLLFALVPALRAFSGGEDE
jgi:membrane fusion protein (multidrug efflux system)